MQSEVVSFDRVRQKLDDGKRRHLLIGNGFSIGCDTCFSYKSLYEASKKAGLSKRAQQIFERFGTNNFEAVMRLLEDGHWLAKIYQLVEDDSELRKDLVTLKKVLVDSIAKAHPDHTGKVADLKKAKAATFLRQFHNIFSLNYDLLPYWINMTMNPPLFQDGFREDADDPEALSLVFSERMGDQQGIYFIHGALHIFMGEGGLRKHCWGRTMKPITSLIRDGLEKSRYPLFVAEGNAEKKMEQIQANGYLSYCYGKLGRIQKRLVTYGFSFGNSDSHISKVIAENLGITELYVGVYKTGDKYPPEIFSAVNGIVEYRKQRFSDERPSIRNARQLGVTFFDSASAAVWA